MGDFSIGDTLRNIFGGGQRSQADNDVSTISVKSTADEIIESLENNPIFNDAVSERKGAFYLTHNQADRVPFLHNTDDARNLKKLLTLALFKAGYIDDQQDYHFMMHTYNSNSFNNQADRIMAEAFDALQNDTSNGQQIVEGGIGGTKVGQGTFRKLFANMREAAENPGISESEHYQMASVGVTFDDIPQIAIMPELIRVNPDYEVRSGDSMSEIAEVFDVNVDDIMRLNSLNDTSIRAGETLKLPLRGYYQHKVRPGEMISRISVDYDVVIAKILAINGLNENSIINPGDQLIIPVD